MTLTSTMVAMTAGEHMSRKPTFRDFSMEAKATSDAIYLTRDRETERQRVIVGISVLVCVLRRL